MKTISTLAEIMALKIKVYNIGEGIMSYTETTNTGTEETAETIESTEGGDCSERNSNKEE